MDMKAAKAFLKKFNTVDKVRELYKLDPEKYAQYRKALNVATNSTEAERAIQQGFDVDKTLYHGSKSKNIDEDISGFLESKGKKGNAKYGEGVYLTNSEGYADQYANGNDGRVYSVISKNKNIPFNPGDVDAAKKILNSYGVKDIKEPRLRSSEDGLRLLEKYLPKEEITKAIDSAGYKMHEDFGMPGTLADIHVDKPENLRMTQAAFDPRFKDSKWIMAGAAAIPKEDISPLAPLKKAAEHYDEAKKKYIDPIVEKGLDQMNFSKDKSTMDVPKEIWKVVADPLNFAFGPVGDAINAVKFCLDMIPKKDENKMKITPENAQKLMDKGLISQETFAKVQNYYNGGKVKSYADGGSVSQDPTLTTPQTPLNSIIPSPTAVGAPMSVDPSLQKEIIEAKQNTAAQAEPQVVWNADQNKWENLAPQTQAPQEQPNEANLRWNAELGKWVPAAEFSQLGQKPFQDEKSQANGIGGIQGLEKTSADSRIPVEDPYTQRMKSMQGMMPGYDEAFNQMQAGINKSAQAGANAAAAATAAITKATDDLNAWKNKEEQINLDRQARLDEKRVQVEKMVSDYTAKATIDPNRFWSDKTTGQKVMAAIGVALGGVGRLGGPNQALDYINNAINRDIDAQKADLDAKRGGIALQNNIFKDMMDQFQDDRAARTASKLAMINIAELQLKKYAEQNQGVQIQANAQKAMGELGLQKLQLQQQLIMQYKFSPMAMAQDDMARKMAMLPPETQKEAMKERGEYQKHHQAVQGVVDAMGDIYKNRISGIQGYSQKQAAITKIKSLTSEIFGGKSEEEFKIIEGLLPKMSDSKDTFNYKVDSIVQKLNSQKSFPYLESYGLVPKEIKMRPH